MKELELELRIRNNRLKQRRMDLGMSQAKLAEAIGIPHRAYADLETMHRAPKGEDDEWHESAMAVANFHCVEPSELFPASVLAIQKTRALRLVDGAELPVLMGSNHEERRLSPADVHDTEETRTAVAKGLAAAHLTPRQLQVLARRFGLDGDEPETLKEVAAKCHVSPERIHQAQQQALRKLRSPRVASALRPFAGEDALERSEQERAAEVEDAIARANRITREKSEDARIGLMEARHYGRYGY